MSKFEVRDENDDEVKRYTYDKNIVEVLVERENTIQVMEQHIHALMNHLLAFLKQAHLFPQNANPAFINKMSILNLQNDFRTRCANGGYGLDMIGAVFQRTGALMNLCHAKKLLNVHGYESFHTYITDLFDLAKKDKKNVNLLKSLKETPEYTKMATYIDETRNTKNHPKLCKLAEILMAFFSDPTHAQASKVIIFSQFRESAKEIKSFLDRKTNGLCKS